MDTPLHGKKRSLTVSRSIDVNLHAVGARPDPDLNLDQRHAGRMGFHVRVGIDRPGSIY